MAIMHLLNADLKNLRKNLKNDIARNLQDLLECAASVPGDDINAEQGGPSGESGKAITPPHETSLWEDRLFLRRV